LPPHGSLDLVDAALNDVALPVDLGVELWWASARAASPETVGLLAGRLGDGGLDLASPQVEQIARLE
jgi:hypothetical protein